MGLPPATTKPTVSVTSLLAAILVQLNAVAKHKVNNFFIVFYLLSLLVILNTADILLRLVNKFAIYPSIYYFSFPNILRIYGKNVLVD